MGLGDVLSCMWGECDAAQRMHFHAQRYVSVELIDPDTGAPIAWREGALGEAVYTTFDRDATPVLRYRSRDHLRVIGMGCACGRTSPREQCIGRTDDMLIYKGMNVFPTAIRDVVFGQLGALASPFLRILKDHAAQVRFDEPIVVEEETRTELTADRQAALARAAEEAVRNTLQVRVRVLLVPPGTLPHGTYKTPLTQARGQP